MFSRLTLFISFLEKLELIDQEGKVILNNPEKYASKYPTKIEYYLHKGYTSDQAIEMISERQKTFILEKLIDKYGYDHAKSIYNNRQEKWLKSLHENGNLKSGYSFVSQDLFNKINESFSMNNFQYMVKNGEFIISKYAIDFIDHDTKRIIEFNGDLYHANPNIFNSEDKPNPWNKKLSAKKIWENDKIRNGLIESFGYEVLVVWESDYRKNPQQILQKCIEFIKNKEIKC
jgi:very-short-patch-repair endonuclease